MLLKIRGFSDLDLVGAGGRGETSMVRSSPNLPLCLLSMFTCAFICACAHVCMWRSEVKFACSFPSCPPPSASEAGALPVGWVAGGLQGLTVSFSSAGIISIKHVSPCLKIQNKNMGIKLGFVSSHAHKVTILLTEKSPQPSIIVILDNLCVVKSGIPHLVFILLHGAGD